MCFRSVFLAILLTMNLNEETNLSSKYFESFNVDVPDAEI